MRLRTVESWTSPSGSDEPRRLVPQDGAPLEVLGVDDRWYDASANFFRVRLSDGSRALLRHDLDSDRWTVLRHRLLDA